MPCSVPGTNSDLHGLAPGTGPRAELGIGDVTRPAASLLAQSAPRRQYGPPPAPPPPGHWTGAFCPVSGRMSRLETISRGLVLHLEHHPEDAVGIGEGRGYARVDILERDSVGRQAVDVQLAL